MDPTQDIIIEFSNDSLSILNVCLAFIMFGIALGIRTADFKLLFHSFKSVLSGVIAQFILLPLFTFLLVWLVAPMPSIALGLILVAACPGGNVSNFISSLSGANIALSVTLTAIATLLCPLMTPLNFHLWASILPATSEKLVSFDIPFAEMLSTVALVLLLPLIAGMAVKNKVPSLAKLIEKPVKWFSFLILIGFIAIALFNNFSSFVAHFHLVLLLVAIHNAIAFALGYGFGKLNKLSEPECRSICIETGIQNSGLGLIIIFTFFGGDGGMALIAAWWGVWHILAGLTLSHIFNRKRSTPIVPN